jgi:hypothetical protein
MNTLDKIMELYKVDLESNLITLCDEYEMLVSKSLPSKVVKSPRWINFRDLKFPFEDPTIPIEKCKLVLGSTQGNFSEFSITIDKSDGYVIASDIKGFWNEFRNLRTNFLIENYPNIDYR